MEKPDRNQKTLFHSTEKSNFILNLRPETLWRWMTVLTGILIWILAASSIVTELTESVSNDLANLQQDGGFGGIIATLLLAMRSESAMFSICGVAALILILIPFLKSLYTKEQMLPALLCGGIALWGAVSLFFSFDLDGYQTPFYGLDGRDEGLLAIIFYLSFFLLGTCLGGKGHTRKICDMLTAFGAVQCFFGILQCLPIGFPSQYRDLMPALTFRVFLPSGLAGSPISFAMLLTMLSGVALYGMLMDERKLRRGCYTAALCVYCVMLLKTQCIAGWLGAAAVAFAASAAALRRKKTAPHALRKLGLVWISCLCGLVLTITAPLINGTTKRDTTTKHDTVAVSPGIYFYDGSIFWEDGSYRLSTAGVYQVNDQFEASSVIDSYSYLWGTAADLIARYPLVGTGPDCYTYSQMTESYLVQQNYNICDRPYNAALYLAATRGIPSLLLVLALIAAALRRGGQICSREQENWQCRACIAGAAGFLLTALFGLSTITVTPFFWLLLGIGMGERKTAA